MISLVGVALGISKLLMHIISVFLVNLQWFIMKDVLTIILNNRSQPTPGEEHICRSEGCREDDGGTVVGGCKILVYVRFHFFAFGNILLEIRVKAKTFIDRYSDDVSDDVSDEVVQEIIVYSQFW